MRIDLHTHSAVSDGTEAPAELMAAAVAAGLDAVALTDHDTVLGWAEAAAAATRLGVCLVPGAELTCADGPDSLHLLAYLFDPDHPALAREMALSRDDRVPRAEEMVRRLAADGFPVTMAAVRAQTTDATTLGRPHIADALVAAGVFASRDQAFATVLRDDSPYYVGHHSTPAAVAVRLVREAGGIPVLAHPRSHRVVTDAVIAGLTDAGLLGLEVDHPDHDPEARAALRALAADLGLLVTGSSDYHGTGKSTPIGAETTDPDVYTALLAQATGPTTVVA
ncbi:MAG TPA: PHP domain-containing protein [Actinomycetes bacterium]|nr:PHP domain-containing protein [Actinomycetes bacterium]